MDSRNGPVLIVDDDQTLCRLYAKLLSKDGVETVCAHSLQDGLEKAHREAFSVVLLDVGLPDGNGLHSVDAFGCTRGRPEIIIVTGSGGAVAAKQAIDAGVWDYVEKGDDLQRTRLSVTRAVRFHRERSAREASTRTRLDGFIASSPVMGKVMADVALAAASELTIAVTGETGTGKELLARGIHAFSRRAAKPFVVVDCTALPDSLVESTLFGHVKGAFTGALERQVGLVEVADGGSLFMDEIGELPLPIQAKFLRLLQEKTFVPVGSSTPRRTDFRLITATNRDLAQMVAQGRFREDLYYRVSGMSIHLPPLRERAGDVSLIAQHHVGRLSQRDGRCAELSPDLLEALERYDWPGNVRELVNIVEVVWARGADSPVLYSAHLPAYLRLALYQAERETASPAVLSAFTAAGPLDSEPLQAFSEERLKAIDAFERQYLARAVHLGGDRIEQIQAVSGLSRSRLYALLKKHGFSISSGPD